MGIVEGRCSGRYAKGHKLNIKHNYSHHPLYMVWNKIKARCYDEKQQWFHNYGGKGVIMCEEWLTNPESFIDWAIANGWKKGLEIDKDIIPRRMGIEPLIYSPEMCMVVTRAQNNNNKKSNVFITYQGETKNIKEWSECLGIKYDVLQSRLKKGWSFEKSIKTPIKIYANSSRQK